MPPEPLTLAAIEAMTPQQVADVLAQPDGRARIAAALDEGRAAAAATPATPPGDRRISAPGSPMSGELLADLLAGRTTPEELADNYPAVLAAIRDARGGSR
jgi:hypothetical protein